jgi:hypothetical protein
MILPEIGQHWVKRGRRAARQESTALRTCLCCLVITSFRIGHSRQCFAPAFIYYESDPAKNYIADPDPKEIE